MCGGERLPLDAEVMMRNTKISHVFNSVFLSIFIQEIQ